MQSLRAQPNQGTGKAIQVEQNVSYTSGSHGWINESNDNLELQEYVLAPLKNRGFYRSRPTL